MKKKIFYIVLALILLTPLWMYLAWVVTPKKKLVAAIIDKTVLTTQGQEHASFSWILDHEKYAKNNTSLYNVSTDYFGFFPKKDEKYLIKGLERFSNSQLDKLTVDADMVYITDAYGIYRNEWYKENSRIERSGIVYGGMSIEDVNFLAKMKEQHKLILTEFNCIGSPTNEIARTKFEQTFSMHWTGWTGRYFNSFDTLENPELPKWIIRNYKRDHNNQWPFKKSGIAFVNNMDQVVILENKTHLNDPLPKIITTNTGMQHYGLPNEMPYPFWFDVVATDTSVNNVIATFKVDANNEGKIELAKNGIPISFPAVQSHTGKDYSFYYFSADFSDNPVKTFTAYFKNIEALKFLFCNNFDEQNRSSFFWKYYQPLVETILREYYQSKK